MQPKFTFEAAQSLCIKLGSSLIVESTGKGADAVFMAQLATRISSLIRDGRKVALVSSGAVALGRAAMGLKAGKVSLPDKQAAAAVGQPLLMQAWQAAFAVQGLKVAQILLTREDTEDRRRWLNAKDTFEALLSRGIVPIVNENDTVATDEIRYGDNDRLAARTAMLMRADTLILMSDIDGLYTADPRRDPEAKHIAIVEGLSPEIEAMAGGANADAGLGSGGMATKLMAARIAGTAGCDTIILNGHGPDPLGVLTGGEGRFTRIVAPLSRTAAYKAWIAGSVAPSGQIVIDDGAVKALKAGRSLLPSGISAVKGDFGAGDTVEVVGLEGFEIARGIVVYSASDIARIKGRKSTDIEAQLGYTSGDEVIHRDDLVMV